jgi:hypothetical protein
MSPSQAIGYIRVGFPKNMRNAKFIPGYLNLFHIPVRRLVDVLTASEKEEKSSEEHRKL